MAILTREQILGADDITRETVSVPEWGGEVIVALMTADDRDYWESRYVDLGTGQRRDDVTQYTVPLVALTVVDEQGNRLFGPDDVAALGRKSSEALKRVWLAAMRINGLGADDVEEMAGN
jgi:hypothetical protein